ncbi:inosine-5-monophosphate dehydrogenase [Thermococci archaeon]|nr:MAG: inosine-5-monophosphate dehydrogenase [Thermococci archaeon]
MISIKVGEVMKKDPIHVEIPGERGKVLELMQKYRLSAIPVTKKRKLVGIITISDLAENPEEEQLALLVRRGPVSLSPADEIKKAAEVFLKERIRIIPVVEKDELIGVISVDDVVKKAISRMNIADPVEKYMLDKFATVWEGTPISATLAISRYSGQRVLPVINSRGEIVGIVDDNDMLSLGEVIEETKVSSLTAPSEGERWAWDTGDLLYITTRKLELPEDKPVSEIMTRNVISVTRKTKVSEVARKMRRYDIETLPVIEASGELTGIIRDIDLLKSLL